MRSKPRGILHAFGDVHSETRALPSTRIAALALDPSAQTRGESAANERAYL